MDEKTKKLEQVKEFVTKLENKDFQLYFFTLDSKGNPIASIANIYEHVKVLNELGYNAVILHEKNDYKKVGDIGGMGLVDWLGEEYANLPHKSIEGGNLNVHPTDFIFIPEALSNIMDQIKGFPCRKVVFAQNYDYILEILPIGKRWDLDYGFTNVITTSKKQSEYIKTLFPSCKMHVVPVSIPSFFNPNVLPKKPIVSILTRNQNDATKIIKSFYLQNPIYKWVTFKELRGLSRSDFADALKSSCLAVWVDDFSSFGTYPIEAMECGTPVIGKIPNMVPEWMLDVNTDGDEVIKNNGIWTTTTLNIPELIATYLKAWLEDSIPQDLTKSIKESTQKYTPELQKEKLITVYSELVNDRINEFNNLIEKNA
jgi:hypothetical protein